MIFRLGAHFTMFQLGWDFWLREVALSTWFHSIKDCQMTKAFRHAAWIYTQWIGHWIMDFGDKSHAWDRSCTTVEINLLLLAVSHPGPGLVRLGLIISLVNRNLRIRWELGTFNKQDLPKFRRSCLHYHSLGKSGPLETHSFRKRGALWRQDLVYVYAVLTKNFITWADCEASEGKHWRVILCGIAAFRQLSRRLDI